MTTPEQAAGSVPAATDTPPPVVIRAGAGGGGRPLLLDLYSCAGIGARGYAAAGFEVTCVDKDPQPNNPFRFVEADVLDLDPEWIATFDVVHASPPCQRYTRLRHRYVSNDHPDLIGPTRELLRATGRPYVIENVEDARGELIDPVMLCGTMFAGLRVKRHRLFETSFPLAAPRQCPPRHPLHYTLDKRKDHYGLLDEWTAFVSVNGGGNCSVAAARDAMGLPPGAHTKHELNEAIPPAYTRFIGEALMASLRTAVA